MAGVFRHSRTVSWAFGPAGALTLALAMGLTGPLAVAYADDVRAPVLELTGMTFLASSGSRTELKLEAETAEIPGGSDIAYLKGVRGHIEEDLREAPDGVIPLGATEDLRARNRAPHSWDSFQSSSAAQIRRRVNCEARNHRSGFGPNPRSQPILHRGRVGRSAVCISSLRVLESIQWHSRSSESSVRGPLASARGLNFGGCTGCRSATPLPS